MSLRRSVISGALWMVALRWVVRLIGLANVAILARLLGSGDFGLIAMAMIVVGLVDALFSMGLDSALIHRQDAGREYYDTAWTLRVLEGAATGIVVLIAIPIAQTYFGEPRVGPLLALLSVGIMLSAFGNIGVVMFRRDLQFQREFWIHAISKVLSFIVSVGLAFALRSYWALAFGIVSGYLIGLVVSYVVHPYRPRFSLRKAREIWSFSQWLVVMNVVSYAENKADEVLVGGLGSPAQMGLYSVASELGQTPTMEIAAPINRVLFPTFAKLQAEPGRLASAYSNALAMVASFTVPAGIGLSIVAAEAISVVLGWKWMAASQLLSVLGLWGAARSLGTTGTSLLMATGRTKLVMLATAFSVTSFAIGAGVALSMGEGPLGIAIAKLLASAIGVGCTLAFVLRTTRVPALSLLASLYRPLLSSAVMAAAVLMLPDFGLSDLLALALKSSTGAAVYVAVMLTLWQLAGRPEGPEQLSLDAFKSALRFGKSIPEP